ncbi:hypothetical protein [Bradyrhizobium sp. AZCC 2289]|uniref:hypothetical protein n=1 Tax=Bradyrhizobium sp. AZCC 2289 TaxID=3117026 RepID=UPI002FF04C04
MAAFAWLMQHAPKPWPPLESSAADFYRASLIDVKDRLLWFAILSMKSKEVVMPIDSVLVSVAVVAMFVIFAGVLAWGERQSRSLQQMPADGHRKRRSF